MNTDTNEEVGKMCIEASYWRSSSMSKSGCTDWIKMSTITLVGPSLSTSSTSKVTNLFWG